MTQPEPVTTQTIDTGRGLPYTVYLTNKGYQFMVDTKYNMHTVDVHNKNGSFAVCFEIVGVRKVGRVWTVAKLDRGAPQIRYVHPAYPGTLKGPPKPSVAVQTAIDTARAHVQNAGYTLEDV